MRATGEDFLVSSAILWAGSVTMGTGINAKRPWWPGLPRAIAAAPIASAAPSEQPCLEQHA